MQAAKSSPQEPPRSIALAVALISALLASPPPARAERLTKEAQQAFDHYIRAAEARMDSEASSPNSFLWIEALPRPSREQAYAGLKRGHILIRPTQGSNAAADPVSLPGGLIHDWTGIVFIPQISIAQLMSVLEDYDHAARYFGPQVVQSRLLQRAGNDFRVFLRLKQIHVVTIVLDTEYAVHYAFPDAAHATSRSYSTRIAEVENAGEPDEREMSLGDDHGFLWRLYSYWRFFQSEDGVYVQCRAISLTRGVPRGLGWLVQPFLESIPRDSLRFTLEATRRALAGQIHRSASTQYLCTGEKQHELKARCT